MAQQQFRELEKNIRKQKIIDTAVELFHRHGYRTTTLDDLARELGISKAALYHYVESKEELLFIIYTQALNSIFEETNRISVMDLPPDEKLRQIIRNHIKNIIIKNLPLFTVFFTEENQLPEKYYRMVRDKKREYDLIIQGIIEEGISLGIFEEGDPRLIVYAIVGMCNWIYKWYQPKARYSADEIADHFVRLIERGFLRRRDQGAGSRPKVSPPEREDFMDGRTSQVAQKLKGYCGEMMELIEGLEGGQNQKESKKNHKG